MTNTTKRRTAFTLVEMLVSAALIIFMMYIIATAFEKGLELFRALKVQGDMQDKLRAAATAIRLDLTAQHFGDGSALSDQRLNDQYWQPPTKGYFRISEPGTTGTAEGVDPDNPSTPYYRLPQLTPQNPNPAQDFYLQFTVNMTNGHPANRDARARTDQFYVTDTADPSVPTNKWDGTLNLYSTPDYNAVPATTGNPPNTQFSSYWAEVTYFLQPHSPTQTTGDGQTYLFDLYRRQSLLVEPSPTRTNPLPLSNQTPGVFNDVGLWPIPWTPGTSLPSSLVQRFNGPADVTEPVRRWGMYYPPNQAAQGAGYEYGRSRIQVAPVAGPISFVAPFQTLRDEATVTTPANPYADPRVGARVGGDLLLTNVVNFDIKVLWEPVVAGASNAVRFNTAPPANVQPPNPNPKQNPDFIAPSPNQNPDYPFDYLPFGMNPGIIQQPQTQPAFLPARVFDTWSSNHDGLQINNNGQTQTVYNYHYDVDRSKYVDPKTGQPIGPQPGLPSDPNFANWNIGHFTALPGMPIQPGTVSFPSTNFTIPLRVRVRALQIKIRIWDQKSSQTRQMTIIQDM